MATTAAATGFVAFDGVCGCDCDCDVGVFGDVLTAGELGMRFDDGGLALLAGNCGGLSSPV